MNTNNDTQQQSTLLNPLATPAQQKTVIYGYPYCNNESIAETMDNYRKFRDEYNNSLKEKNRPIELYNAHVKNNLETHKLTVKELFYIKCFKDDNRGEFTQDYNKEVERFNETHGLLIPKKKFQKLKDGHTNIFHVYALFLSSQIRKRNSFLLELNQNPARALDLVKINYHNVAKHKINGHERLTITKRTIQDYTKRLREAGAITQYYFVNSKKPVQLELNPSIAVVFDYAKQKKRTTENQEVTTERMQNLHNNSVTTRTFLKRIKKKEIVENNFKSKNVALLLSDCKEQLQSNFYKNTNTLDTEKQTTPREISIENEPEHKKLTRFLKGKMLNDQDFARKLTQKEFSEYTPISHHLLQKEAQYGTMTNAEFRLLIIQEILKIGAKIWSNHNVFGGNWQKTIYLANDDWFISNNGHNYNKVTLIRSLKECTWRLNWANNWFENNPNINALFPFDYFDKSRKLSSEIGFRFTKQKYKQHLARKQKRAEEKKQLQDKARKRQRKTVLNQKIDRAIGKFFTGKYTQEQLYSYFADNLGHDLAVQLPLLIKQFKK